MEKTAAAVVFEGWDASGKGGSIKRLVAQLDARRFEVVTSPPRRAGNTPSTTSGGSGRASPSKAI